MRKHGPVALDANSARILGIRVEGAEGNPTYTHIFKEYDLIHVIMLSSVRAVKRQQCDMSIIVVSDKLDARKSGKQ